MAEKKLTPKQKLFVAEYLVDLNATQAAIRAGYPRKTARQIGQQNLSKLYISAEIQAAMKKRELRTEIKQDRVLKELAFLAFSDMKDYVEINPEGAVTLKPFDEMPEGASRAVSKVKEVRRIMGSGEGEGKDMVLEIRTEYSHHDKVRSLELCMKHLGMLTEKLDVTHDTYEERLRRRIEERKAQGLEE